MRTDERQGDRRERLGSPAALHRHRRRRDERPGAGLPRARRRRSAAATAPTPLIWSGCGRRGSSPAVGHDAANLPEGAEVVVSTAIAEDNPELAAGPRARPDGPAPRRAAGRALRREAPDRGRRHPRQDDDDARCWSGRCAALGADPAFFVGGEVPGPGPGGAAANAGWGGGEWVVAEADESDASFLELRPEIAVITNIEMDHHSRWGSLAELRARLRPLRGSDGGAAGSPSSTRRARHGPGPSCSSSRSPAATTCSMPARRWRGRARPASTPRRPRGARRLPRGRAPARAEGEARRRAAIYDDYAHHPTEVRAALAALRELEPERLIAAFQPHLYSRTKAFAERVRRGPRARRRGRRARRLPGAGGAGRRAGRGQRPRGRRAPPPTGWAAGGWSGRRRRSRRAAALAPRLGAGDVLVTIGAGDVFKLGEALVEARRGGGAMSAPPDGVERDYPAGAADHGPHRRRRRLVRPARDRGASWSSCSPGPRSEGLAIGVVGSGSNLLVADDGLPRAGAQARRRAGGDRARRASGCSAAAAPGCPRRRPRPPAGGSPGLEFGVNIPGTVGGAVKMNANAYGGQLAEVLEWVDVCTAGGPRAPRARAARLRLPQLEPGARTRSSRAPPSGSRPADPEAVKATMAAMRERRREAQPSGIKTFGSTFKNPEDPRAEGRTAGQLLEAAGCRGPAGGGARFSEKHANFVENTGRGDDRRRARADGRGPPPGPRALRRRARARGADPRRGCAGRRAGSCEAAARCGRRRRSSVIVGRRRLPASSSATRRSTPTPGLAAEPVAAIGTGSDAVAVAADGTVLAWLPPPEDAALPPLPLDRAAEERPRCAGPGAGAGPGPRRGAGGAAALHGRAATTAKAGSTSSCARGSNCASATPPQAARKWRAAAAVLADPSIDGARLCRPARAAHGPR